MFADERTSERGSQYPKKLTPFSKTSDHFNQSLYLINESSPTVPPHKIPPFLRTMAIETTSPAPSVPSPSVFETQAQRPRPQDVGILGIEMYFPQRVRHVTPCYSLAF